MLTCRIDPRLPWPPPDPDRIPRPAQMIMDERKSGFTVPEYSTMHEQIEAFYQRQQADLRRRRLYPSSEFCVSDRHNDIEDGDLNDDDDDDESSLESDDSTAAVEEDGRRWRNAEGERLGDFGVDEEAEFYDEEEVPLAKLIERRKKM